MFPSSTFAPLYAERYLEDSQHHLVEGYDHRNANRNDDKRSPPGGSGYNRSTFSQKPPLSPQLQRSDNHSSNSNSKTGDTCSPTETETDDYRLDGVENYLEGTSNLMRKATSSGSLPPASPMSPLKRSFKSLEIMPSSDDSRVSNLSFASQKPQLLQEHGNYNNEMALKDKHIKKLMKKLDKMQRRVVDLEGDLQGHDLRFARYTESPFDLTHMKGEKDDRVSTVETTSSSNSTFDEEKQKPREKQQRESSETPIGPEAKRLISRLLKDYDNMERMYKKEKYSNTRDFNDGRKFSVSDGAASKCSQNANAAGFGGGAFEPNLQEECRVTHSPSTYSRKVLGHSVGGSSRYRAPDPPEMSIYSQTHYVHPSYRASSGEQRYQTHLKGDDDDRYSDDLSSRHISVLIDEDVNSQCKAVKDHNGGGRQYWRDIILGVNDGLVSTFLLVAGVRGGGMSSTEILLTAIAGSVAGAVSMCAGEYVATKSQNEVVHGEIAREQEHIQKYRRDELTEVTDLLELIGIGAGDRDLQKRLVRHYARDPQALLKIMIALELGFLEDEQRSPIMAGMVSFFLFLIGAAPSVIPFMIPNIDPNVGFIAAGVATCVMLLIVGAVKTWATNGNLFTAALENLVVAGFGGAIAFGAGLISSKLIEN